MKLKAILFDLDGTLLPMDQSAFVKDYFGRLVKRISPLGYAPDDIVNAIWTGTAAMVKNDGKKTNEEVFWDSFAAVVGERIRKEEPHFAAFYREEFDLVRHSCGFDPDAAPTVSALKKMGLRLVLATNPLFPSAATECRIRWAGLSPSDFERFTTYEGSRFCKPSLRYYEELLSSCALLPEECLMVGNDVAEDMVAEKLGMRVFLLPRCLLNKKGEDISRYPQGDLPALLDYVRAIKAAEEEK